MAIDWLHPLFWAFLILSGLVITWLFRRSGVTWLPAWFSRLILVVLSLIAVFQPEALVLDEPLQGLSILILDQSDSIDPVQKTMAQAFAEDWAAAAENRLVIPFGSEPMLIDFEISWPDLDGRDSALLAALHAAQALLLESDDSRLIIATDGLVEDLPEIAAALVDLEESGTEIELVPLAPRPAAGDISLGRILSPSSIWAGTTLDVILPVYAVGGFSANQVTFKCNDQKLEPIGQGQNYLIYHLPKQAEGITTLSAEIAATGDPFPGNNVSFAAFWVFPSPRTLFLSADFNESALFTQNLREYGLDVEMDAPQNVSTSLETLRQYQLIFLHNMQALDLSELQMSVLRDYVRLGYGGVVFLGGESTYSLGGFENTLLEAMLPVSLDPPARAKRSPMLTLLVLDRSGSMGVETSQGALPIDLAKESAMRVVETLSGEDYLGLMTYSLDSIWHVPIRILGEGLSRREALDAISEIKVDSLTNMYGAMEDILAALRDLPVGAPEQRYLLLLSDGKSSDGSFSEFVQIAEEIANENVVISTIAMGEAADEAVMQAIADAGNGRFYLVEDVSRLPAVMFAESQASQGLRVQIGETMLSLASPGHPVLSGMSPSALPRLQAYNALSSKSDLGAEDILVAAGTGDPILSSWQYGLGRVTAWMGDVGEAWVESWARDIDEARFWSQVVHYTLPNPTLDAVQAAVTSEARFLNLAVKVPSTPTIPGTRYQIRFTFADEDGQVRVFEVPQVGADTFELSIDRPVDGAYRGVLSYQVIGGEWVDMPAPFTVNPPLEWARPNAAIGLENLANWESLADGRMTDFDTLRLADMPDEEPPPVFLTARGWLVLIVLILWPVDIALRRRFYPWH